MIDVCLLGTGGTMPLPERALTSLLIRFNGKNLLVDCGEGTQVMIRKSGFSLNKIDAILITHFHADHISGIVGLLLSMAKCERTEQIEIIGGKGIESVVRSLCVIAGDLPFEIKYREIESPRQSFQINDLRVETLLLNHSVPCYGYAFHLDRIGKFMPQKAAELGIDPRLWGKLQSGQSVESNGIVCTPDMVLGQPRNGLKITYCTDTRPTPELNDFAKDSDLFICEGMYAEDDKLEKAAVNKHMMFREAAEAAKNANVKKLWLTHFSPSIKDPDEYAEFARSLFENTTIPHDLELETLKYTD